MMKDMFHPEFTPDFGGVTTSEERMKDKDSVELGTRNREQDKTVRVGGNNSTRITGNEDEEEI